MRGQNVLKVYIIFNMLDVADRLFSTLGQDLMDTVFWTATRISQAYTAFFLKLPPFFSLINCPPPPSSSSLPIPSPLFKNQVVSTIKTGSYVVFEAQRQLLKCVSSPIVLMLAIHIQVEKSKFRLTQYLFLNYSWNGCSTFFQIVRSFHFCLLFLDDFNQQLYNGFMFHVNEILNVFNLLENKSDQC